VVARYVVIIMPQIDFFFARMPQVDCSLVKTKCWNAQASDEQLAASLLWQGIYDK